MKKTKTHDTLWPRSLAMLLCLSTVTLLSACEKSTVDVNLHGVNYSGETFSYVVSDPAKPESGSGGELIDPFGAGGMTCCVTLPKVWRPGIKLKVRATHWLKGRPDGSLPQIKEEHLVEVPMYVDGKPGEVWVLREADGKVSVISSDFQPDHPKWPGTVKGWPVPSLEYRRERWELLRKHEQMFIDNYLDLLAELEKSPSVRATDAWKHALEYDRESLHEFAGPDDPKYLMFIKQEYATGLTRSRERLAQLMELKP